MSTPRVSFSELPQDTWHHFLRARDVAQIFGSTADVNGPVLEIGCGDGFVTSLLRQRFNPVFTMDPAPRAKITGGCVAVAERLPFADNSFGCLFSSNVLEHVPGLDSALSEMRRVLRDDGIMIHTIPTVTWKILQMGLYPAYLAQAVLAKFGLGSGPSDPDEKCLSQAHCMNDNALVHKKQPQNSAQMQPSRSCPVCDKLSKLKKFIPPVHGAALGNLEELLRFRSRYWVSQFENAGFSVYRQEPLFLHSAYRLLSFRGLALRELVSRMGAAAVTAFWCRKNPQVTVTALTGKADANG